MENLIKIEYCPELNQASNMTKWTIKQTKDFTLFESKKYLDLILEDLKSEDGVILQTFLTHWNDSETSPNWHWNKKFATLCAFPKYGEIDYLFKKDGYFWVMPNDPYKVKEIFIPDEDNPGYLSAMQFEGIGIIKNFLLFRKNILEHPKEYEHARYLLPKKGKY